MNAGGADAGTLIEPNTLDVLAPAKVNLFLRVLRRRDDGYHDVQTLVVPLSLADRIRVHAHADPSMFRTLSLALDVTGHPSLTRGVPVDETNLALRAAAVLADVVGARGFAEIVLDKRIPSAAGLGGGSSDAAAVLLALDRLWGTALDHEELRRIGATFGSDVPALMTGAPALATGRGEVVERAAAPALGWVVVTFPFGVRTADAFRWWDEDRGGTGPDPSALLRAARGADPAALGPLLFNDLEGPVMRRHPVIREVKERLLAAGLPGAAMCGSGASVAGIVPTSIDRAAVAELLIDLAGLSGRDPMLVTSAAGAEAEPADGEELGPRDSNADLRDQNPASLPLD